MESPATRIAGRERGLPGEHRRALPDRRRRCGLSVLAPLAAPLHRHSREDEYSFVLEGRMCALLGDDVVEEGPGDLVFKPRDTWHTFWNAGDEPCRILEVISPAGFEAYFRELVALGGSTAAAPEALADLAPLAPRYGLEVQAEWIPELVERFGLRRGEPLPEAGGRRAGRPRLPARPGDRERPRRRRASGRPSDPSLQLESCPPPGVGW